jgi:DNA-directed RNA polymerase, mitochondrial
LKNTLIRSLNTRIGAELSPQNPVSIIGNHQVNSFVDTLISIVYLYTRPKKGKGSTVYLAEVISAIGHTLLSKWRKPVNSALAAKVGAFMLYSFEDIGLIEVVLGHGSKGHNAYLINVIRDEALMELWNTLPSNTIEKLPSKLPYTSWTSSLHPTGVRLVKTQDKNVLLELTPESHPIVFNCLNKAQKVGWRINKEVLELQKWAIRNRAAAFDEIWTAHSSEARSTKSREAKSIISMADRFVDDTFYHLYYLDFRGRKYAATAYLHEQGSDVAKGLLLRDEGKAIGKEGFHWLLVRIASNWAGSCGREDEAKSDKIPLKERYEWVLDNEEIFMAYAESPKVNQGWMTADKPWQFIAACKELYNLRMWQIQMSTLVGATGDPFQNFEYVSRLEAYLDGTNNGSQHLAALTRDEITAPYVNLVPSVLPGDLYEYVAEFVWETINETILTLTGEERALIDMTLTEIIALKKMISEAETVIAKELLITELRVLKGKYPELDGYFAPCFWARITSKKERRKIVKRNVMTLPYGGTPYGLGQQQIDDARKHKIVALNYLEHKWASYMGRLVFDECRKSLQKPTQLLLQFEKAGTLAEQEGRFLSWKVPVTNFPVVQYYTEGVVKKIWVAYGPKVGEKKSTGYYANALQIAISFVEDTVPSKGKQAQGAAPNAIHSLDAAHLMLIVDACDFGVTTVHDSFGALLADVPALYVATRQQFVRLYQTNPLERLFDDMRLNVGLVSFGTLDIAAVLDSEYCFS